MKRLSWLLLIASAAAAQPIVQSVVNSATLDPRVCAGALVNIFGGGFSSQPEADLVMVGGKQASIITVSATMMTVQLPVDLPPGNADVVITVAGEASMPLTITLQDFAPGFYSINGAGAFFNTSNVAFTSTNTASIGQTVNAYMVGLGPTNPVVATGMAATGSAPTNTKPTLTVGNQMANISYAGWAMGKVGVYQVVFTVPGNLAPGNQNVILQIGSRSTPAAALPVSNGTSGIASVTNGATFQVKDNLHPVAPNSFVSIFASNIGSTDSAQNLFPATTYQNVSVLFNGKAAPLYFVFPSLGQINLVVPSELPESGTSTLTISNSVGTSQNFTLTMGATDIGVFRLTDPSNANRKNGAVLFANTAWRVMPASMATALGLSACVGIPVTNICGKPATIGDTIQIYFTGGGKATPGGNPNGTPLATGQLAPADGSVLYQTVQTPTVRIGAINAQVLFSGIAPGNAGLYQVNAVVPVGSQLGDDVPVIVAMGGTSDTVTIAVH
jgi:uncharacterized protein (TIGR03437 family)